MANHLDHVPEKGAADGLATLDGGVKVPVAQLPAATTSTIGAVELATDGESAANVVVQGNDARMSNARIPTGAAGGDLAGTYANPTVAQSSTAFALNAIISPASFATQQNDYNPAGLSGASVLRLTATAQSNITGLAGGVAGRVIILWNVGSSQVVLKKQSVSSTAANRFALATDIALVPNGSLFLQYDATSSRWRVSGNAAGGGGGTYNVSFGLFAASVSYIEVSSLAYADVSIFRFPGTTLASIISVKAIFSVLADGPIDVRLFDLTNATTIAEVLSLAVTTTPIIYDLGTVSNTPTGEAIIAIQLRKIGGGTPKPRIHAIDINAVV